jgi:CoA:oxalate CoA-transferase
MEQALAGLRVLDLTRVLAGPYCTMVLADLGADVVKVEIPETGDDSRHFGPYVGDESAYFMSINRGKRSIALNLKDPEDKARFLQLVQKADVVVENYRPGTMEKLGLGYEVLQEHNPAVIYAAVSGFGHTGPYSHRPAYDAVVQAMGGIMSITGPVGGPPVRVGTSIGDITAGLFTAIGILTALQHRNRTGEGQKVDVAMLDCQLAVLENAIARYSVTGEVPGPDGNRHPSITPFETFPTSDGEIMIAAGNDALFKRLCQLLSEETWLEDERFLTNALRTKHREELTPLISARTKERKTSEWQNLLDEHGVPNGPINRVDQVLRDPQIQAREMVQVVMHPDAGPVTMAGIPVKLSRTPGEIRSASPRLGEHMAEVLADWLGNSGRKESQNI